MERRSTLYQRRTIPILLLFALAMAAGAADDPFVGTWRLNIAKSKYKPGPLPISSTNTYEPISGGGLKLTVKSVLGEGRPSSFERIELYDGKPHRVEGERSGADMISTKRIDPYTIEVVSYKKGKAVTRLTRKVSNDGKTMTSTSKGINEQGQRFEEFRFFDRQ